MGTRKNDENTNEMNVVNGLLIQRKQGATDTVPKKKRIFSYNEQTKKQVIDFYINSYGLSFSIFTYFTGNIQQHLYLYSLVSNGQRIFGCMLRWARDEKRFHNGLEYGSCANEFHLHAKWLQFVFGASFIFIFNSSEFPVANVNLCSFIYTPRRRLLRILCKIH